MKKIARFVEICARWTEVATEASCKVLLSIMIVSVSWVVFSRYFLGKTPRWGETLGLMTMVWFGLLSASLAVRRTSHLKLSLLDFILPKKILKVVDGFVILAMASLALFFVIGGIYQVRLTIPSTLSGVRISSAWLYLAVPVSGAAIFLQLCDKIKSFF